MNLQHLLQHRPEYDYAQPNSRRTLFGLTVRRPPKLHLLKSSLPSMAWGGWKNCRETLDKPRVSLMSRHTGEFSLSANEKPRMRPATVHFHGPHRPRRSSPHINFRLKAPWSPRSSARRRLERLRADRGRSAPVCCSYVVPTLKIKPPSEYNIEYNRLTTILNKTTEYRQNKNLNFFDIDDCKLQTGFTYWELKAG
jgi:hypothetical protein